MAVLHMLGLPDTGAPGTQGWEGEQRRVKEGMGAGEEQNAVLWAAGSISLAGLILPVIKFLNLLDGSNPTHSGQL